MTDQKLRSPTGHSIASDVTDKMPPKDVFQRVIDEHNTNDLLAEAVNVMKKAKKALSVGAYKGNKTDLDAFTSCRDFLAKIER